MEWERGNGQKKLDLTTSLDVYHFALYRETDFYETVAHHTPNLGQHGAESGDSVSISGLHA
jgi:hypothetical protein